MKRFSAILLLLLLGAVVATPLLARQDKDKQGDKGKAKIDLADARMEFSWTIESTGDGPLMPLFECTNRCNGKKHEKHSDCDLSCDTKCGWGTHSIDEFTLAMVSLEDLDLTGDGKPTESNEKQMGKDFEKFGVAGGVVVNQEYYAIAYKVLNELKKKWTKQIKAPCWNKTPCSSSTGSIKQKRRIVTIEYELLFDKMEGKVVKETEHGPKRKLRFAIIGYPADDEDHTLTYSDPKVNCKCEVVQPKPEKTSFWPGEDEFACVGTGKQGASGTDVAALFTNISVQDMNHATVTVADNAPPFFIPAGWEFECVDGSCQNVQLVEDLSSTGFPCGPLATKTIRVMCLQIHKPEPKPGVKYRLVPPATAPLARIARLVRKALFRGPNDQVRLWIAENHATIDEIAKVLIPSPTPTVYLNQLYSAAQVLAIIPEDPEIRKMMDPALLLGDRNDPEAAAWLLRCRLASDAAGTTAWLKSHAGDFRKLFQAGDATEHAKYVAHLAFEASRNPNGLAAAACLLKDVVPEEHRKTVAETEDASRAAAMLSITSDAAGAERMLDWLQSVRPSFTRVTAQNLNPELPAKVISRASELARAN